MSGPVIVIGAGIVGVSTAIWLRRLGREVIVIDRLPPGQGTSYGNAGVLASCSMVPVTTPGLWRKAPGMLMNPDFPLFMRWSYLPRLAPWLMKYMRHANDADTRRISKGLTRIVGDSVDQHLALSDGLAARSFVRQSDYTFAYAGRAGFDRAAYVWALRRDAGFEPELIEGGAVREYDPAFGPDIRCLAVMKDHGYVTDPGGYVAALAEDLHALGGKIVQAEVRDLALDGGRIVRVETDQGGFDCDRAVLAAGVWSAPWMKKLGLKVPLESERGYHIVFKSPSGAPRVPSMIASGKFVATPMAAGLRCAGIVEFGGTEAGPSKAPLALLRRQVRTTFPGLEWTEEEEWVGHRPAPADSLPLIGEVGASGVFAAFGHHHIGLTGGPKTGRLVAQMIAGDRPNLDLAPFNPQRFN